MSTVITINSVTKKYGDKTIIPDLSLRIEAGEFFTLLGPSGCGKTTLLRMIAGFNTVEAGEIYFNEQKINDVPPHRRNIGMVFQNYAIFPHMNVRKNIEYGLRQRRLPKKEYRRRADEIMEIVRIAEHADRTPDKMSGGQQQRIALARAIVIHPTVLLMDEPLSNLDAKLRVDMRSAIRDIQKKVNITTVYVTHDQEEALAISDRIAVMNLGELYQVGTPENLYKRPADTFTANFVGASNFFDAICKKDGDRYLIVIGENVKIPINCLSEDVPDGAPVKVGVRPEEFFFAESGLPGIIKSRVFLGQFFHYEVALENGSVVKAFQDTGKMDVLPSQGDTVRLGIDPDRVNIFQDDGSSLMIR